MTVVVCRCVMLVVVLFAIAQAYFPVRPPPHSCYGGMRYDSSCRESIEDLKALVEVTQSFKLDNNNYTCPTCAHCFSEEIILKLVNALIFIATNNCGNNGCDGSKHYPGGGGKPGGVNPGGNVEGANNSGGLIGGGNTIGVGGPVTGGGNTDVVKTGETGGGNSGVKPGGNNVEGANNSGGLIGGGNVIGVGGPVTGGGNTDVVKSGKTGGGNSGVKPGGNNVEGANNSGGLIGGGNVIGIGGPVTGGGNTRVVNPSGTEGCNSSVVHPNGTGGGCSTGGGNTGGGNSGKKPPLIDLSALDSNKLLGLDVGGTKVLDVNVGGPSGGSYGSSSGSSTNNGGKNVDPLIDLGLLNTDSVANLGIGGTPILNVAVGKQGDGGNEKTPVPNTPVTKPGKVTGT